MNARAAAVIGATTIFAMAFGILLGEAVGNALLGAALGAAAGVPLGVFFVAHRRRWIAVALLNIEFVLSYAVGGFLGFLFSITAAALTFFVSACILRDFYGGSEMDAFEHHAKLAFGITKGLQFVDAGNTASVKKGGMLLGPRLIIVKPGTAVTMERGQKLSRVSGPAIFTSDEYEYVKDIINIKERQKTVTCAGVTTHDLILTSVTVEVTYGLDIGDDARRGERNLSPDEESVLRRISVGVPNWEDGIEAAVQQAIRQTIGAYRSQDILRGMRYPLLAGQILQRVAGVTQEWGVRVRQVVLESIQPSSEIVAAMDSRWAETARAVGMREALTLLAEGYRRAKHAGMDPSQIALEVLRRTLEQMARDPATKFVMTSELAEFLRTPARAEVTSSPDGTSAPSESSSRNTEPGNDHKWMAPSIERYDRGLTESSDPADEQRM